SEELEYTSSSFLTSIRYLEDEFFVDSNNTSDEEFPVLLMDWVDGVTLDTYIRTHLHDSHAISILSYQFGRLASWLLSQPFAHGDLKPDNILVKPDGTLCLVDYDGMFVPAMQGSESPELGTPDFRHPLRTVQQFNEHIDDFSLASMALSLKALSLEPSLLGSTGASEGLLFFDKDYRDLGSSVMLQRIIGLLADAELATLYSLFILAFAKQELSAVSHRLFLLDRPTGLGKKRVGARKSNAANKATSASTSASENLTFTVMGLSFELIRVEGGTFQMGATPEQGDDAYDDEIPVHSVTLSSYALGKYPVTQALWEAVMGDNPSYDKQGGNYPVEYVSWNDCQAFIKKLNSLTGKTFSLPTEAQWEFAARGGVKSQGFKYAGSHNLDEVGWYLDNSGDEIHPVGEKRPNELGLFDMSGHVWEWCLDWYGDYSSASLTNPAGPSSGDYRVLRGGSYWSNARCCQSSNRFIDNVDFRCNNFGLRLAILS
ncbi:MAG: SUMF1/EgtB/PvdO family nonheme iron enzyme, partial [Phocaeicola sp.]